MVPEHNHGTLRQVSTQDGQPFITSLKLRRAWTAAFCAKAAHHGGRLRRCWEGWAGALEHVALAQNEVCFSETGSGIARPGLA